MSEQKTQQKLQTFRGKIENVESKNTCSGLAMVVFKVNGYAFKAFGYQAQTVRQFDGQHAKITAKHNTYMGKDEYAVVTISGEIDGHPVAASDASRSVPASSVPQQRLKHSDRHQWHLPSYGSNVKAREVGVWLNQFFDNLTEAEWRQWKEYPNSIWPIHDTDRQAEREHREKFPRQFKEDFERRYGRQFPGTDEDILCSYSGGGMPQDLDSVKERFCTRLDEVHEDLRRKSAVPTEERDETQGPYAPQAESIQVDSTRNPLDSSYPRREIEV
jgi:hypothetical protein